MPGTLYIVATPIGNLEDVSARALRVLGSVDWIACEDTRRTSKLMSRFGIETRMVSCHRFNERKRLEPVLRILRQGGDVALVSDGGTPGVSDPGTILVAAADREGIRVVPLPGPSAVVALLSVTGLPSDRFVFDGFLPHRAGERRRRLRELRDEARTLVVFETPHRIRQALRDMAEILGDRTIVLARELTKRHEAILKGTARELECALGRTEVKGEITLAVAGATAADVGADEETASQVLGAWRAALEASAGDARAALRLAARSLKIKRAELYRRLAELGETDIESR